MNKEPRSEDSPTLSTFGQIPRQTVRVIRWWRIQIQVKILRLACGGFERLNVLAQSVFDGVETVRRRGELPDYEVWNRPQISVRNTSRGKETYLRLRLEDEEVTLAELAVRSGINLSAILRREIRKVALVGVLRSESDVSRRLAAAQESLYPYPYVRQEDDCPASGGSDPVGSD